MIVIVILSIINIFRDMDAGTRAVSVDSQDVIPVTFWMKLFIQELLNIQSKWM